MFACTCTLLLNVPLYMFLDFCIVYIMFDSGIVSLYI